MYRWNGRRYGFLLEYDRGTANRRDYRRKLAAYYAFRDSGDYRQAYRSFPMRAGSRWATTSGAGWRTSSGGALPNTG